MKPELHRDNVSCGRSMVEMLGVLAIIGVLSVGAIAGYSKAMMKYRLNKQAQQVSTILNAGIRYSKQWNFSENTNTVPYFIKLGEIPKEMIRDTDNSTLYDVFGTEIYTKYTINGTDRYTQFFLYFDMTKADDYGLSICRNVLNTVKEFRAHIRYITMMSKSDSGWDGKSYYGDDYCTGSRICLKNVTVGQIEDICRYNLGKTDQPHLKIVWNE